MIRSILQWKLKILARAYIRRYQPMIIAVTGNAGKSSTKEAIGAVVSKIKRVRAAAGNLNDELGVPMTIVGDWGNEYYQKGSSLGFWFKVVWLGFWNLLVGSPYPEVLVLEYGADHPGDIRKLATLFPPHISVVTTVGGVPVHIEFFKDADAVADEKANLVRVLGASDFAMLNQDDRRVMGMSSKTKARVVTYGFDQNSGIRASDVEYLTNEEGRPLGVTFKLNHGSSFVPVRIEGSLGKSQALTSAAAAAVGLSMGMNLVQVSNALREYKGPKGRLKILKGIKNSNIIDDTYNASPASTRLALETLRDVPSLRKLAVLGDMLELGEYTEEAHKEIGRFAGEILNALVCVGARAKFIAETAAQHLSSEQIFTFATSEEAKLKVQELVREHDLILVKGSQGMRMEKIVEEIMAEPENKQHLLVRQSKKWLAK